MGRLVRRAKRKTLLYLSKPEIRNRLDGPKSDCKSMGVLSSAIAHTSRNFEQIPQNSNQRLAKGYVARGKGKNYQKMGIKYL